MALPGLAVALLAPWLAQAPGGVLPAAYLSDMTARVRLSDAFLRST
jgi:hypothetical protein